MARLEELTKLDWYQKPESLPNAKVFQTLVDVAFHASLMTDEKRRPGFRIIFCSPEDIDPSTSPNFLSDRFRAISIRPPRAFTAQRANQYCTSS